MGHPNPIPMPNAILKFLKLHKLGLLLACLSLVFYYTFAYQLERTAFVQLLTLFIALFLLCFKLIQFEKWNFKFLLVAGILFRLIFLIAEPNLSQDFYRFIWDGQLVSNFINPYKYAPNELIAQQDLSIANAQALHHGMGELSARHFSNYPPLNQLLFGLAVLLGGKSILSGIVVIRSMVILADIGIFYFGRKLLKNLNLSPHLIFWYFLNPLVIVELTGNLHFEGVMLFFFIISMYLLSLEKWQVAAVFLGCSISVKLVPLLFLPLFLKFLGFKRSLFFYLIVAITVLLLFIPFYTPEFLHNYHQTLRLWFSNFEFNAGLYNVVEQIAIQWDAKPWEFIKSYGSVTPFITIGVVLLFTFFRKNENLTTLLSSMMWVLALYYFMATTVHPWYCIFLILLAPFTSYRFALVWSAAIVLSYFAYSQPDFTESMWLLAIEYIAVFGFLGYEIISQRNKN